MASGIDEAIPVFGYRIVNEFPHDRGSFTQGLVVDDRPGTLLEGSGLWGKSSLRRVDLLTGEVIQLINLPEKYFGEGITQFGDRIFQLTWKSGVGFIYDGDSFELLDQFNYAHEGWGITHDGKQLIVSDGTNIIYFWDPETLLETARIQVFDDQGPVTRLNELEFVNGEILAHVWQTDIIVRIDPQTGQVLGKIDLSGLLSDEDRDGTEDVLNGIAYDVGENRIFVTGKLWPKLFEIELLAPAASTDQKTDQ
jgi:glutamine cyclotransferase